MTVKAIKLLNDAALDHNTDYEHIFSSSVNIDKNQFTVKNDINEAYRFLNDNKFLPSTNIWSIFSNLLLSINRYEIKTGISNDK